MKKYWLPVLACTLVLAAGYDALNRIALIHSFLDTPDHLFTQTVVVSNISTKQECSGTARSRICRYQAYLTSKSEQSYRVFMPPLFEKGLDRLYGIPEGSIVSLSHSDGIVYAFELSTTSNDTTNHGQFSLSEFKHWRSEILFSASAFLILDGLIIILFWRRISSMSPPETKAFVKFALVAFAVPLIYLFFPRGDLPRPEELHNREITFSHLSRQPGCPPVWPTHARLTCDFTPYLISKTGERWTFGPGYKLPEVFAIVPPSGTILYLKTYRDEIYQIQRSPTWADDKSTGNVQACDTKLVPVEDEGLVHWVCEGRGYIRPATHQRKASAFYQTLDRNLSAKDETLKDLRTTLMSYDAVEQFHQERQKSRNYLAGTVLTYFLFSAIVIILIRTFWLRKRGGL